MVKRWSDEMVKYQNGEMVQWWNGEMVKWVILAESIASVTYPFTITVYQKDN